MVARLKSRSYNVRNNMIWGVLNKLLNIILSFAIRTLIIYMLGIEYAGLGTLFSSVLKVLNLAELGFGNAIVFSMYKPIAENDSPKVNALLSFYRKCYRIVAVLVFVLGIALLPILPHLIKTNEEIAGINIYALFLIYLANTISSYLFLAYKRSILIANQRNDIESNVLSITTIIQYLLQIIIIIFLSNYYLYTFIMIAATIAFNLLCAEICDRKYPGYKCEGQLEPTDLQEFSRLIKGLIIQKIGGVVLSSVDSIVISAFLGVTVLGIYNNYYYVIAAIFEVLLVIMNALKPSVGNSIITEDIHTNFKTFKLLNFMYLWLIIWISICLLCLLQNFMFLWMGKALMLSNGLVILFTIYFFVHKWFDMLFVYQEAAGLWWENRYIPGLAAVLNLALNIFLIKIIGLAGVLISTIISVLIVYNIGYAYILFKYYFKETSWMWEYIRHQITISLRGIVAGGITWLLCEQIQRYDITGILIKGLICVIIPNLIMLVLNCRSEQLSESIKRLKRVLLPKRM